MVLTEYDEQAHIRNEREIAREEGRKAGEEDGRAAGYAEATEKGLKNLVTTLKVFVHYFEDLYKAVIGKKDYENVTREQVMKYYNAPSA